MLFVNVFIFDRVKKEKKRDASKGGLNLKWLAHAFLFLVGSQFIPFTKFCVLLLLCLVVPITLMGRSFI